MIFKNLLLVSWRVSYSEILVKYRRSFLGPVWISVNMIVTIFALSLVFSGLFQVEIKNYLPYVFCGLLAWTYISFTVQDGVQLYINGSIKNFDFPSLFFPLKNTFKHFIIFLHNFVVYFLVLFFVNSEILNINIILIFIALPFYIINSILISFGVGLLSLRYRDVGQIIINGVYLLFLVTPVFWDPSILSGKKTLIADLNPLFHMIQILREPLLGNIPTLSNYTTCILLTLVNGLIAFLVFKTNHANKAFWI